ncbi:MAG: histidinol-phosphatase, partial [Acidimicrobiia bacterium]|nr:histidinol-phosphatase [Acidimicrobiia bacterium]
STAADLADAQVSVTLNEGWRELGLVDELTTIALAARRSRSLGDFWQHVLVAEGALDVAIDAVGVADYDLAAVRLVVEEAGGTFTDRAGVPAHDRGTAVSSNGLLHDEIVARLSVTPA